MFGKNIKLKSSVEKSSTLVNGKVPWCGVDSCLEAWIISPSVDNSHDVKKLSWAWFEPLRFGVPIYSRTFERPRDRNTSVWRVARYDSCWRDTPHADTFLTGFYYGFIFSIFWLSSWQRIDRGYEPLRFQSHLALIIINYQLDFSLEEVSTALVPVSQKKKKKCQPL